MTLLLIMSSRLFYVSSFLNALKSGIGFGLHSVAYTWLLLVLVFVVYGAAGVTFYAENDPYHFGTIAISMWTFFQISTLDVSYISCKLVFALFRILIVGHF